MKGPGRIITCMGKECIPGGMGDGTKVREGLITRRVPHGQEAWVWDLYLGRW